MKEIIVKTQKDLDKINPKFDGYIYIEGGTIDEPLILKVRFEEAYVITRRAAVIEMRESRQVLEKLRENSKSRRENDPLYAKWYDFYCSHGWTLDQNESVIPHIDKIYDGFIKQLIAEAESEKL